MRTVGLFRAALATGKTHEETADKCNDSHQEAHAGYEDRDAARPTGKLFRFVSTTCPLEQYRRTRLWCIHSK